MTMLNHCRRVGSSSLISKAGRDNVLRHGGMVLAIHNNDNNTVASASTNSISSTAHHHYTELYRVHRFGQISKNSWKDFPAAYASFSILYSISDLFKVPCVTDNLNVIVSGHPDIVLYLVPSIFTKISQSYGSSVSSGNESECHSVCHDVHISAVCNTDKIDRVNLYPLSERNFLDTLPEESLYPSALAIPGKADSGLVSSDALCDESAPKVEMAERGLKPSLLRSYIYFCVNQGFHYED